jgi:hypothetical protein
MTEEEWLSCTEPARLLEFLRAKASERKLRLLMAAACRRVIHLLDEPEYVLLIEAGERVAEGKLSPASLARYRTNCSGIDAGDFIREEQRWREHSREFKGPILAKRAVWFSGSRDLKWVEACLHFAARGLHARRSIHEETVNQCRFVMDVIGNPFHPVQFDARWRTTNVMDLARTIYEERTFERLPILADALMDAGCADEQVLAHCRSEGPHVRGCWVVDLILGKE